MIRAIRIVIERARRLFRGEFKCHVCGIDVPSSPPPPDRPVCEAHCVDHDYQYERGERGHFCIHCGQPVPYDWYSE